MAQLLAVDHNRDMSATPLVRVESDASRIDSYASRVAAAGGDSSPLLSLTVSALGLCAGSLAAAAVHVGGCATGRAMGDCVGGVAAAVGAIAAVIMPGAGGIAARFTLLAGGAVASRAVSCAVETSSSVISMGVGLTVAVAVTGGGHAALAMVNVISTAVASSAAQGVGFGDARAWEGIDGEPVSINCVLVVLDATGNVVGVAREGNTAQSFTTAPALTTTPFSLSSPRSDDPRPVDATFYLISAADTLPHTPAPYVLLPPAPSQWTRHGSSGVPLKK